MSGKEKLYFLLNRIDDVRTIAPSGQPLIIDPTNDLNRNYRDIELAQLFTKLEKDERVLKILQVPSRTKEIDIIENLDPYDHTDDGCWHIELLPAFDNYFLKIQQETEYQEFTGRKSTPETETQRLYGKIAEVDEQIRIRRDALTKAQSSINDNPLYSEATRVGHLAKLEQQAQADIGNFIKQKETYLTELSLRKVDIQLLKNPQEKPQIITSTKVTYDPKKGELDIEGKKIKFKKDSFRAKLLQLLLKDNKSSKKEWSWDEVINEIQGTEGDPSLQKENKKKFYPACDGISKFVAQKTGINDLLIFNKSTAQINPKYL